MVDVVPTSHKKNTARGIVVHDGKLLLMERWRPRLHYFSIPGGGIEPGETAEQAVAREIPEETSIKVQVERQVLEMRDGGFRHQIYLCRYVSGEPHMPEDAPEILHASEDNRFKPRWIEIERLPALPFTYWYPLKQPLIAGLREGFGSEVVIVSARPTR